jgi:hypothetical protein
MSPGRFCPLLLVFAFVTCAQVPDNSPTLTARPKPLQFAPGPLAAIFETEFGGALALADTTPTSTSYALSQLAFGGGWYTAMYFSNPTSAALTANVKFFAGNGTPLGVPLTGIGTVTSQTIALNPNATTLLEAPNTGDLQQGWVQADLPTGLIGTGVFRQSASGRSDNEAVVLLTGVSKQQAVLTFDDNNLTTAIAIVNPSSTGATVNISVYGDDGTLIGTSSLSLGALSKTASNLKDLPGLAGVTGHRGMARFTVTSGAISVLGLRFNNGGAFTSIPVTYP